MELQRVSALAPECPVLDDYRSGAENNVADSGRAENYPIQDDPEIGSVIDFTTGVSENR